MEWSVLHTCEQEVFYSCCGGHIVGWDDPPRMSLVEKREKIQGQRLLLQGPSCCAVKCIYISHCMTTVDFHLSRPVQ